MSSDEEEGVAWPAKFKAAKGKPDDQAAEPVVDLTEDPQAAQLWATRFIKPTDSTGHDEVIYVGTGGQPAPQPSRGEQEMQQAIDAQVKALTAAERAAARQQQIRDLLGPEEAAKYSRFKEEERRQQEQATQAKQPKEVYTAQQTVGPLTSPRGKPNPLV